MFIGVGCAVFCWFLNTTEMVRWLENWWFDTCFVLRGSRPTTTKVVIVGIDDQSLQELGKPLAFISPEFAKVVTYLRNQGAAAVGFDILIPKSAGSSEYYREGQPGDADSMGRAVAQARNVVLPEWRLADGRWLTPLFQWRTKQQIAPEWNDLGYVNLTVDGDTFIRRHILGARGADNAAHPSFALAVFSRAAGLSEDWFAEPELRLGAQSIARGSGGVLTINFVGPPGSIPAVSFGDVLRAASGKGPLSYDWRGAMVLVGMTGYSQQDQHATPYSNQSIVNVLRTFRVNRHADQMAGVEIHANIIATLGDHAFITTPWWLSTPLLLILVGAGLGAVTVRLSLSWGALVALLHHWIWKVFCVTAFAVGYWRVEAISMLFLGVLVYGSVFALRWRWMRQMMGLFKSEAVAQAMESDPRKLDLQGEDRVVTVLFSDVRDFTSFSEKHTAHEVVRLLNEYYSAVVPIIEAHGGTVNQYIGDGLMVIFGAPASMEHHAYAAVRAAIETVQKVHFFKRRWEQLGAEGFRIGVGIHTGKVVVGTIGSPRRLDYTAIGDTVNTASRIESGNKELKSEILVSQATCDELSAQQCHELGLAAEFRRLSVKGKREELLVRPIVVPECEDSAGQPCQTAAPAAAQVS